DKAGTPGTDLTFFPWPDMGPSNPGVGLAMEVVFGAPVGSLEYWQLHLSQHGVTPGTIETRFGERVLPFRDPHGLHLSLVETSRARPFVPWEDSAVPTEHQLHGMDAVRLWERKLQPTEDLLTGVMGFERRGVEDGWVRFGLADSPAGTFVEVHEHPNHAR